MPFGGFYSCQNGNPLTNGKKACPKGFNNHLATILDDCEIEYCVQTGQLSNLKFPTVHLPPFSEVPAESLKKSANYLISHDFESWIQLIDPNKKSKNPDESTWKLLSSASSEMKTLKKKFSKNHAVKESDESGMSKGAVAGLSAGVITAVGAIVVTIVFLVRRKRKHRRDYDNVILN